MRKMTEEEQKLHLEGILKVFKPKEFTEKEIEKLKNITILQMAQQLEDGLIHSGILDENMSVLEFIKHYLQ